MTSSGFNVHKNTQIKEEVLLLWTHWKCFTAQAQTLVAYLLRKIQKDFENKIDKETLNLIHELVDDREITQAVLKDQSLYNACYVLFTILKTQHIKDNLKRLLQGQKTDNLEVKSHQSNPNHKHPTTRKFDPINALLPSLKHYYLMSRVYSERISYQQEPQQNKFYQPPRLFRRGQQLWEAQGKSFTTPNKGVLLLTVEGTHIAAGRGMAISNGSSIEWWTRRSKQFRGIIGEQEVMQEEVKQNQIKEKVTINRPDNFPTQLQLEFKFIGHEGNITSLSLSYDQFFLLSSATDRIIKLWCLRSKILLLNFKSHTNIIWSTKFSDSGYFFLSSSADKSIKLWKTDTPVPVRVMLGHKLDVYLADFMKNPDYVISCSADKSVRIWSIENAQNIRTIKFDREVIGFTISFSGRYIVTNQINGVMTLFDLTKGEEVNVFNLFYLKKSRQQSEKGQKHQRYPIHDMTFSPDQEKFACISKKQIAIYSMQALKQKISTDIYEQIRGQRNNSKQKDFYVKPKQVLDIGTEMNLLYCRYHSKDYLIVAGKK